MNQLRAKRDSMRDSRGGLFSYRDFKKPPISIYTIYYFLVFPVTCPVKILSPFPTRRPSERPPAPPRVLLLVTAPRTTRAHSLSLGSQCSIPHAYRRGVHRHGRGRRDRHPGLAGTHFLRCTAPVPTRTPTAPNHFCVYLFDVNYTSSTTASFSLTPTSPPSVLPSAADRFTTKHTP